MQASRKVGLELPMKVLAWEDDGGQVWLGYVKPERLKTEYSISGRDDVLREMTAALDRLTDEAAGPK